MNKSSLVMFAGAFALFAGAAQAASVTNRDVSEHYLQIVDESGEAEAQDIVISANQSLDGICMEGCTIGMEDGDPVTINGSEKLVIEDGVLGIEQ